MPAQTRRPCAVGTLAVGLLLLVGCTAPASEPEESPVAVPSVAASEAETADGPAATVQLTVGGGVLDVDVLPLQRVDGPAAAPDLVLLTLELSVAEPSPDGAIELVGGFADLRRGGLGEAGALRLLDLDSDRAHLLAADAEGRGVATGRAAWTTVEPEVTARLQALYAAPPADVTELSLLVPGAPLVDAVPVVDAGPRSVPGLEAGDVAEAAVRDLEVFSTELDGAVRTLDREVSAQVDLAADVLFATDSAELAPAATAALATAVEQVRGRAPGPVTVVGHTDDQGEPAYNLDLSERRAQAVSSALGPLLGPEYPLTVQARGESEPAVAETTPEARALNRRVTLAITTAPTGDGATSAQDVLPAAPELVGDGAQGVLVDDGVTRPYRVRVPEARRVQDHLVVDVQITAEDDEVGSAFGPGSILSGRTDPRGTFAVELTSTARGLTLLQGSRATYSLDHVLDPADPSARLCVCDPNTNGRIDGGQTTVSTVVFPAVDVGAEVVLQFDGRTSFRLVDIPVR